MSDETRTVTPLTDIDTLTAEIDRHWLYQGIETGIALCTCGGWSFDAHVGRAPLPTVEGRFSPFSRHVAEVVAAVPTSTEGLDARIVQRQVEGALDDARRAALADVRSFVAEEAAREGAGLHYAISQVRVLDYIDSLLSPSPTETPEPTEEEPT